MNTRTFPTFSNAQKPCTKCRYYEKGRCKLFLEIEDKTLTFAKTHVIRFDEKSCGPEGLYWMPDDREIQWTEISDF
jgi:hypothetical protein